MSQWKHCNNAAPAVVFVQRSGQSIMQRAASFARTEEQGIRRSGDKMMTISFTCSTAHLLTFLAAFRRSACPNSAEPIGTHRGLYSGSGIGVRESVVPSPARHGVTMIRPEIRRKCVASQARSAGRRVDCSPHEPVWTKVHTTRATCTHERSPGFSYVDRDGYPMPIVTQCVRCVDALDSTCRGAGHRLQTRGQRYRAEGGRLAVCFAESPIGPRGAVLVR